jgi:hypothetical protein
MLPRLGKTLLPEGVKILWLVPIGYVGLEFLYG